MHQLIKPETCGLYLCCLCHNLKSCGVSLTTLSHAKVPDCLPSCGTMPVPVPVLKPRPTQAKFRRILLSPSSGYPIPCDVMFPATRTAAGWLLVSMPSRDRGSTWQHGCGPEGKIRGGGSHYRCLCPSHKVSQSILQLQSTCCRQHVSIATSQAGGLLQYMAV
jgi:hypothetical protein